MSKSNFTGEYRFLPIQKVLYGEGIIDKLSLEVERLGSNRVVIICSNSLLESNYVHKVKGLLGEKLISVVSGTKQHTLSQSVFDIASKINDQNVDLLISLGGGTVIDTTKAVSLILGESLTDKEQLKNYSVKYEYGKEVEIPSIKNTVIPHIAIPTTLSAAEFSNIIGITDEGRKVKELFIDDKLTPVTVFLDPEFTVDTPDWLWLASGIRALDHAIETVYSKGKQLIPTTLAIEAIKILTENLPKCKEDPHDLFARLQCQQAAWMSFFGVTNVMMGLSHGIGHQIGAHGNVAHGITSCIMLPHVMRYSLSETVQEQAMIAQAMGANPAGKSEEELAKQASFLVEDLVTRLDLPTSLREVNISKEQFNAIAADAMADLVVASSPRAVHDEEEIMNLLNMAW
ncbi:iron-containing alcohol dehydrogenase [Neobacillus niacini]|uniref:iron-containing alcohol dehydrogenase n=1 Tax=Neobacillus niacini TaxID=86668 RepID=UPI003B022C84